MIDLLPPELKVKIIKKAIDYNDLDVIKTLSLLNREFSKICYDDKFWYQLYYAIDDTIDFGKPYYKTWKKTLLKRKRAFTTDELINEYVSRFLRETFIIELRKRETKEEEVEAIIERLSVDIPENIMNFLEGHTSVIHKYHTFWWTDTSFYLDFNEFNENYFQQSGYYGLAYTQLMSIDLGRPIENVINPYGKLRTKGVVTDDNNGISDIYIWELRPFWSS